jgi:hypothetical protein
MSASRPKIVTLSTVAAGIVVLGAAVAHKDRLLERWYLYQLQRADSKQDAEGAGRAIVGLSEEGSETALVKLLDRASTSEGSPVADALEEACEKISDRIGDVRFIAFVTKYIRDSAHDARTRAHLAILPFDSRLNLNQSREFAEAREAAIATYSELLDSKDETASLSAARFFLCHDQAQLDKLSNAAKEIFKKKAKRAIECIRGESSTAVRSASPTAGANDHSPNSTD